MIYTYRNTRTGAVIKVPCPVSGKYWELEHKQADPVEKPSTGKPRQSRKKATE